MTRCILYSLFAASLLLGTTSLAGATEPGRPDKERYTRDEIATACAAQSGVVLGTSADSGGYSCHTAATWIWCPDAGPCTNGRHANPPRQMATAWPFDPAAHPLSAAQGRLLTAWPWTKADPGEWPFWEETTPGALVN